MPAVPKRQLRGAARTADYLCRSGPNDYVCCPIKLTRAHQGGPPGHAGDIGILYLEHLAQRQIPARWSSKYSSP